MDKAIHLGTAQKVFYRPIEAAIRWSGLVRREAQILEVLGARKVPDLTEFPRWPWLCLNAERIFDALANGDLPYGKRGLTCDDPSLLEDPDLTIRHVDLKFWMGRVYPDEKPDFLFGEIERSLHPAVSVDTVHIFLAERAALKIQLANYAKASKLMHIELQSLRSEQAARSSEERLDAVPGARGETTYLNIVGGLLGLLLGNSPGGNPYSMFRTQEAVISALIAHHEGRLGISERTLETKFAAARRHLADR